MFIKDIAKTFVLGAAMTVGGYTGIKLAEKVDSKIYIAKIKNKYKNNKKA